jgi:hypothetical protein
MIGEQGQISHYVAERTGGEYFSAPAQGDAAALEKILMQLHFRYELGFIPPVIEVDRSKRTCPLSRPSCSPSGLEYRETKKTLSQRRTNRLKPRGK